MTDPDRLPVVVAAAQCLERRRPVDALGLMTRAAGEALEGTGPLRAQVDRVSVVNVLSPVGAAPASALAAALGLGPGRREVTTVGGNGPQWLVSRAADDVAAGAVRAVLVAGAEAQRSQGTVAPGAAEPAAGADPVVGDDRFGASPAEMAAGLLAPVHVYALFESALAGRAGRTPAEQRRALGHLMAPFTAVAAGHRCAWFPLARRADELAEVGPDNRLVAEPYPKRMCAFIGVDQAAAVVVTSLGAARRAGLEDQAVFCWSGADAADVWFPSQRPDLDSSPGIAAAGRAALTAAGVGIDDVDLVDLYSCFPSAVQLGAAALGIDPADRRGLTVTGGLAYFGGPGNDYSLHAIATMAERLRAGPARLGLVTAMGWYATKHAVGVYGATPPPAGWRRGDTTSAQAVIDAGAVPVVAGADGGATVVAGTVGYDRAATPTAAPVVARLDDGRRVVAACHPDDLPGLAGQSLVGRRVTVAGSPPAYRVAG